MRGLAIEQLTLTFLLIRMAIDLNPVLPVGVVVFMLTVFGVEGCAANRIEFQKPFVVIFALSVGLYGRFYRRFLRVICTVPGQLSGQPL